MENYLQIFQGQNAALCGWVWLGLEHSTGSCNTAHDLRGTGSDMVGNSYEGIRNGQEGSDGDGTNSIG